jgi:GR25 family glycosyltransferase involved in LPS biosynthesis
MKILSLVINLPVREDRRLNVVRQFQILNENFKVVEAIDGTEDLNKPLSFSPPKTVVANWNSHIKCFKEFLLSDADVCFIFEDDVVFESGAKLFFEEIRKLDEFPFDILQFGYLGKSNSKLPSLRLLINFKLISYNIIRKLLKIFNRLPKTKLVAKGIESRIQRTKIICHFLGQINYKGSVVSGFLSGTHAYAVGRKSAKLLSEYNRPPLMGADLALKILGMSPNWNVYHLSTSLATQDNSVVSIGEHASKPIDLAKLLKVENSENWH